MIIMNNFLLYHVIVSFIKVLLIIDWKKIFLLNTLANLNSVATNKKKKKKKKYISLGEEKIIGRPSSFLGITAPILAEQE